MRKLTDESGSPLNFDDQYGKLGKANQCLAALAEDLGIVPMVKTFEGRLYISNVNEIHDAADVALKGLKK